jgi:hypothetical protein
LFSLSNINKLFAPKKWHASQPPIGTYLSTNQASPLKGGAFF